MIITLLILLVIGVAVGFYFFREHSDASANHYNKTRKNPASRPEPALKEDSTSGLGLNPLANNVNDALSSPAENIEPPEPVVAPADPVVLFLLAPKSAPFGGYELLQALLSAGSDAIDDFNLSYVGSKTYSMNSCISFSTGCGWLVGAGESA